MFFVFVFVQVLLDDAISSVELVNCQRMQVQVRGCVPSVAVDKTDGFLCYLGKDGLSTSFITSKVCRVVLYRVLFPFAFWCTSYLIYKLRPFRLYCRSRGDED